MIEKFVSRRVDDKRDGEDDEKEEQPRKYALARSNDNVASLLLFPRASASEREEIQGSNGRFLSLRLAIRLTEMCTLER